MPIMDDQLVFCESMSTPTTSGNHVHGTNIVYIPKVKDHTGTAMYDRVNVSGRLFWNCVVEDEDLLAGTDGAVVTFYLYNGDTGTNPLIDNSGVVLDSCAITENTPSDHKDGTLLFSRPLPAGQLLKYLDLYITVGTQNISTGKVTSWIGGPVTQG